VEALRKPLGLLACGEYGRLHLPGRTRPTYLARHDRLPYQRFTAADSSSASSFGMGTRVCDVSDVSGSAGHWISGEKANKRD
jgi:hypothetical protein